MGETAATKSRMRKTTDRTVYYPPALGADFFAICANKSKATGENHSVNKTVLSLVADFVKKNRRYLPKNRKSNGRG